MSRTVADANQHPAQSKFRQFHAPKIYEVIRKKHENEIKVGHLCKQLSCRSNYVDLNTAVWSSPSSFAYEYYPFLKSNLPFGTCPFFVFVFF
jgi:hypothetical protein